MRILRLSSLVLALTLVFSMAGFDAPLASAQGVGDAEDGAADAKNRADVASGLVDEAVAEREAIELDLVETIARLNDLAAHLSIVGARLDRLTGQLGFADVELAGIQSQIEVQAVDAYMTVVASPTFSLMNTETVEKALVASSVVEDVVANGRETVDQLVIKRRNLEELQSTYLASQAEFAGLQEEVNAEAERLTELYEEADQAVATAVGEARQADSEYRAALTAVDIARAREAERQRQEERSTTTTTSANPTTTTPGTVTTTAPPNTTTTSGGGGTWNHPPQVEQWRPLVTQYFPSHRVEEALRILDCESNGDPDAYNPYSGASGLFQFLPSTWATTAPKAGWDGYSVFHPEANISSAAWLANRYEELGSYYWQAWSCRRVLN
ncbi:MAG: transglycosylase SLT domain-containing protein [Actinomycetota bacterium]|nr:transglycosylase SLT domain-containing protein [Actinomycetota bacterium]